MPDRKPTLRSRALGVLQFLFVLAFALFFLVAIVLVLGQFVGTLFLQGTWVSALTDHLFIPAVSLASIFGVIAFAASYLGDDQAKEEAS